MLKAKCPEGLKDLGPSGLGMSNLGHEVDDGFPEMLRSEPVYGRHAACNFNASVWYSDGKFRSDVWQYHEVVGSHSASSLEELMKTHCNYYGYD